MVLLLLCLFVLLVGYGLLSRVTERVFGAQALRPTPVQTMSDAVDYVSVPKWRLFLIELLNIAGLGPIYGAISGALFGPMAFVWIVVGSLLIGGIHDYFSGMISVRHSGKTFAELTGYYLGKVVLFIARLFNLILLVLLGVVFIKGPSSLLAGLFSADSFFSSVPLWLTIITAYAVIATFFPIDKILGRLYPLFGLLFILMALGLAYFLIFRSHAFHLPSFSFSNFHYNADLPMWPILCVTIACGAVSGFHATQTPIVARCLAREIPDGRQVFYGAMIAEAIIALMWAAASMSFFESMGGFAEFMQKNANNPGRVVSVICQTWFGKIGGILAIVSVVVAPITSAGSALRVLRMSLGDWLKMPQNSLRNRLIITVPIFVVAVIFMQVNFEVVWRYFAFSNQTLAMISLWTGGMFLVYQGRARYHWYLTVPAFFMTVVVTTYIGTAPEGIPLNYTLACVLGWLVALIFYALFFWKMHSLQRSNKQS